MDRFTSKRNAKPSWINNDMVAFFYKLATELSKTGEIWHVDHIVPIRSKKVCGLHWEGNLQLLKKHENLSKNNHRWPDMP